MNERLREFPASNETWQHASREAAKSLTGAPVGTVAMVHGCIGYKKMPFVWNVRVHGLWVALREKWNDFRSHLPW